MSSFNKVLLMGNLVRDPQVKHLPSQTVVAEFGVAVNRKWKDQQGNPKEEVAFLDVSAFGRTAEVIAQHFTKGKPIFIEGRLKQDTWEDKQSGQKRSKITVVLENFQFVGGRDGGGGGSDVTETDDGRTIDRSSDQTRRPAPGRAPSQRPPVQGTGATDPAAADKFDESDVPF